MEGTFAVCARMLAAILSPSADITLPLGPRSWMVVEAVEGDRQKEMSGV